MAFYARCQFEYCVLVVNPMMGRGIVRPTLDKTSASSRNAISNHAPTPSTQNSRPTSSSYDLYHLNILYSPISYRFCSATLHASRQRWLQTSDSALYHAERILSSRKQQSIPLFSGSLQYLSTPRLPTMHRRTRPPIQPSPDKAANLTR